MSRINKLLEGKNDVLDVGDIERRYPWAFERRMNCILSPDSDGLLCGLFMNNYLKWNVVGFYDGKVLLLKDGVSATAANSVFLDMEIYRPNVRSIGHHMVLYNRRIKPENWDGNYCNCLQPNLLRGYDAKNEFRLKYPLATIHLLLALLGATTKIALTKSAIAPLLFVDGTFNVLFSYPENVMNWLHYLGIENESNTLRHVFLQDHYTIYEQMKEMDKFFRARDVLNIPGERGDKFAISDGKGAPKNIDPIAGSLYCISPDATTKVRGFIKLLSDTTGWSFDESSWCFRDLRLTQFSKDSFQSRGWTVTNTSFTKMIKMNPLSWAQTSGTNIEFTIEKPGVLR